MQRLLEHAGDGEGLLSWRRLVAEYEPATAGRETSLLLEVLAQTFKGDVRGSLDEFEVKMRRYERSCNEVLSDRVKIAVVQKGIEDEDLRRHVLMHASRLSTYPLVREGIRSIIMARETLNGPTPMDVSAIYKGKEKGKEKGKKGKGKSKGKSDDKGKEKDSAANPVIGRVTASETAVSSHWCASTFFVFFNLCGDVVDFSLFSFSSIFPDFFFLRFFFRFLFFVGFLHFFIFQML